MENAPEHPPTEVRKAATAVATGSLASAQDLVGALVGGTFRVVGRLGHGGMAAVYRAFDEKLERPVALKIVGLATEGSSEEFSQRFIQEAKILASLQHPGLATVYAFGEHEGALYMALELIDGRSLHELIWQKGVLPPRRSAAIAIHILDALAAAHSHDIIHRDVKPGNVMIVRRAGSDRVKLLDFGVAKLLAGALSEARTDPDTILGTPQYMAPELIKSQTIDGRCDLYAVGVVLYEMLTGSPPFKGRFLQILDKHVNAVAPPLRARRPEIPESLERVVMKALAKRPDDRYPDARTFADALEEIVDELSEAVEPGSGEYEVPSPGTD